MGAGVAAWTNGSADTQPGGSSKRDCGVKPGFEVSASHRSTPLFRKSVFVLVLFALL